MNTQTIALHEHTGWVDSHAHITPQMNLDGIAGVIAISTQPSDDHNLGELAKSLNSDKNGPWVRRTVGVHPSECAQIHNWEWLNEACKGENVVGVGECGLDTLIDIPMDEQQRAFDAQINIALQNNLPLIVHTRNADSLTLNVLKKYAGKARGILHCFTGSLEFAMRAVALGWYISFSGIITYKSGAQVREVAQRIPLDRLLVETDSPWLSPVPVRGKPNVPGNVRYVGEKIAEIRDMNSEEIMRITARNACELLGEAGYR